MQQPEAKAWNEAVGLLARREHSSQELRGKLRARKHESQVIEAVLHQLREQGLQSDERFAQACSGSLMERGYGSLRVRYELREKGASEVLASTHEAMARDGDLERAQEALRRRHPHSDRGRMLRFLNQRGYPSEVAIRAADVWLERREELL